MSISHHPKHGLATISGAGKRYPIERFASPGSIRIPLVLFCLMVGLGFGPADYYIHICGDYYIIREGGNRFSLASILAPPSPDDKTLRFRFVYKGIATYATNGSIIFGTTVANEYYLFDPTKPISIFSERKQWEETLGSLGVHDLTLKPPSPPDDNLGFPRIGTFGWTIVIATGASTLLLGILLAFRSRKPVR
jgi:hypothetical protein